MIRMSLLRHYPVVCEEKQLGLLQSICLDEAQKRVYALIVSCGILGKRVVFPEHVISLGNGFMLVDQVLKYRRSCETAPCLFVRDSAGLLVGRITDYALDERTLDVLAIEMKLGYLHVKQPGRFWLYAYTRAKPEAPEVTVPVCMGSELIGMKEEAETCACPP